MLYEVEISETYKYTTFVEAENDDELQRIVHEEIPTLINMNKKAVKKIINDKNSNFHKYDEITWYERN